MNYTNLKQSNIKLNRKAYGRYAGGVDRFKRKRERRDKAGAIIALLLTYGLLIYFMIETIAGALL